MVNLREFVSINTDVVALVAEDLRVGITGWSGDGRGHEESEDDELKNIKYGG